MIRFSVVRITWHGECSWECLYFFTQLVHLLNKGAIFLQDTLEVYKFWSWDFYHLFWKLETCKKSPYLQWFLDFVNSSVSPNGCQLSHYCQKYYRAHTKDARITDMTKVAIHNSVQWLKCVFLNVCMCIHTHTHTYRHTNNCTIIRYNDKPTRFGLSQPSSGRHSTQENTLMASYKHIWAIILLKYRILKWLKI